MTLGGLFLCFRDMHVFSIPCIDKNSILGNNDTLAFRSPSHSHIHSSPLCTESSTVTNTVLFVYLSFCGPGSQMPAAASLVIALMFDGDFAEMADDVFHLGIASTTALATEIVEPRNLVHQIVDNGNDNLLTIR